MPDTALVHLFEAGIRPPPRCLSNHRIIRRNKHGMQIIIRRSALMLGLSAALAGPTRASAQTPIPPPPRRRPSCRSRKARPCACCARRASSQPDEEIFRANTAKFAKKTGIEVKVDFVGWEDIRQQTAVSANTGAGPDLILGLADDPHIYADKLVELSDVAEYLGKRYGGWMFLGEKYGKKAKHQQLDRPADRRHQRPDRLSDRRSRKPASTRSRTTMPASSSSARR